MRYPASEKLEIIRLVEQSHQPVKRTLEQIGVSRPTFLRIPTIATTHSDGSRPPVPIDCDRCGAGACSAVGC